MSAVELVLVPFDRVGAEALHAAASVGLDTDDDHSDYWGVDLDAGFEANKTLRRALDSDPNAEAAIILDGITALDDLLSHDRDVLVGTHDESGIISTEAHAALGGLLALLRSGVAEQGGDT